MYKSGSEHGNAHMLYKPSTTTCVPYWSTSPCRDNNALGHAELTSNNMALNQDLDWPWPSVIQSPRLCFQRLTRLDRWKPETVPTVKARTQCSWWLPPLGNSSDCTTRWSCPYQGRAPLRSSRYFQNEKSSSQFCLVATNGSRTRGYCQAMWYVSTLKTPSTSSTLTTLGMAAMPLGQITCW